MPPRLHPAEKYARDVLDGIIPSCHWVKRACARYFDDLKHAKARGLVFDRQEAQRHIDFMQMMTHYEGELAGVRVALEPFQQFVMWNIYGWYRAKHKRWDIKNYDGKKEDTSGTRRFRAVYWEMARKNAKTYTGAFVGLSHGFLAGEGSNNVYSAATKRDQARICFDTAKHFVESSPFLVERGGVEVLRNNLNQQMTYSKFEPLAADSKTMDGLRVQCAILDEVHAWKSGAVYDKLLRATSSRSQPMIYMITTAGRVEESKFCWLQHEYTCKVLDRIIEDDTWFGIIYTIDDGDKWEDPTVWIKANPGLGVIKKMDYMRTEAAKAAAMPTALNDFLQFDLNVWVRSVTKWMPMDHWRLCAGPVPASAMETHLLGRTCYAGLDLASVSDLAALVFEFPPIPGDPLHYVLPFFFVPNENIMKRATHDRVPYDLWNEQGYLIATPGEVTDESFIVAKLGEMMRRFNLSRLYFDRYGSKNIMNILQNDLGFVTDPEKAKQFRKPLLVEFGQGYLSMSSPMKDMLRLTLEHKYAHGNHPVLNWNMDNLIARADPAGNIKPDKAKSAEKIDGGVALIMAHAGSMNHVATAGKSIYSSGGIIVL